MSSPPAPTRLARLRDLALILVCTVGSILATLLVVGHLWFRSLLVSAFGQTGLGYAAVAGALAAMAGAAYVLLPPHRSPVKSDLSGPKAHGIDHG